MDYLKSQLARVQEQLAGLTASQKMLTGALVAVMVMTLAFMGRYAGVAEMEPVLNQSFPEDDLARITAKLASKGIPYKVSGDKILVPADRKIEVLADLSYAQLLPRDTKTGYDEMVKQITPWSSASEREAVYNRAKEMTLSQVIRNFPDVTDAKVIIDPTQKRLIGSNNLTPSATVTVTTRGGAEELKHLVAAAADVVAGAQAGLARSRIHVIVNGKSQRVADPDSGGLAATSESTLEAVQRNERHYADKIAQHLAYIPGVMASVTVDVNTTRSEKNTRKVLKDDTISKEIRTETRTQESTSTAPAPGDVGITPNVQVSLAGGGSGGGSVTTDTLEKTEFTVLPSTSDEHSVTAAGDVTVVSASVRVPRSYFVSVLRGPSPDAKEPDEARLAEFVRAQLPSIKDAVMSCTGLTAPERVTVDTYADVLPLLAATAPASAAGSITTVLGGYGREIAVGGLALVSLFLVSMMVRRSSPAPVMAAPAPAGGPAAFGAGEALAGEAGEGGAALDGMELDEDAVRSQQMLDQVSTMVKENPDAAAALVKRWLNRS